MTPEQMTQGLSDACEQARQHVARDCGVPFVLATEAMGYRIVPEWVVAALAKVIAKAGVDAKDLSSKDGA